MREGVRNFMVGITSIVALIALAALLMSFGELDPLLNPRYKLTLRTDNAAGLRPGGGVEFSGVPIGVIHSVYTQQDPNYPVVIECLINHDVRIPADVKPSATSPLIGGSGILQLEAPPNGQAAQGQFLPVGGTAELVGPLRGGMLSELSEQLDERLKPVTESLERFNKLADTYIALGENLNTLLVPQSDDDLASGQPANLRTAVAKLNQALDNATEALEMARAFLSDEQVNADARAAISKAKVLIDQATAAFERYTKLADTIQTNTDELTKRLLPVADSLGSTLEEVRRLTLMAREGKGTLGNLLNNPDLYNSLNDAAIRLERTLVQIQVLIEKLQQEGFDINF
ncbi:MAG: MlaD family protein [Phycisphaerales bacterium]|nr:MlaD family protein [Phycisphaerales bacterium]